jgi:hypothetical protein
MSEYIASLEVTNRFALGYFQTIYSTVPLEIVSRNNKNISNNYNIKQRTELTVHHSTGPLPTWPGSGCEVEYFYAPFHTEKSYKKFCGMVAKYFPQCVSK